MFRAFFPRTSRSLRLNIHTIRRSSAMAAAVASGSLGVSASDVTVSVLPPRKEKEGKPAHIVNGKYINPWPSFRIFSPIKMPGFLLNNLVNSPKIPDTGDLATLIPWNIPTWGVGPENSDKIKATWLGHAAFLVELPAPPGALRGARILFDPVLSNRCSPSQWLGPARYTQAPCTTANIPVVDAIVISHNHYDHMDETTIKSLLELHSPQLFVPAGNEALVRSWGFTPSNSHALDWWDSREISLSLPSSTPDTHAIKTTFALTFTPSQHQANRGMFDRGSTLWGSWALEGPTNGEGEKVKVYFAGDTGYRTVKNGEDEDKVPVCPAFREIGEKFGGFDLALLPIGAYSPRDLMSCVHASPSDSVRIFQDVRAKRALAMHWGTWVLTPEPIMEPPQKLREETKKAGIAPDVFDICQLGETRLF